MDKVKAVSIELCKEKRSYEISAQVSKTADWHHKFNVEWHDGVERFCVELGGIYYVAEELFAMADLLKLRERNAIRSEAQRREERAGRRNGP